MSDIFNVEKQLSFYGAYHNNKWNILVHIVFVPLILWTAEVFLANLPPPAFIPFLSYPVNDYLLAETNWAVIQAFVYFLYYLTLEPLGALLFLPQTVFQVLTATAFAQYNKTQLSISSGLHIVSWIAQFAAHTFAEKRAPALFDNLLASLVLAPFFVHLECLFYIGFKPTLHKRIVNLVGIEITRIRKLEGQKKREADAAVAGADGEKSKTQ